MSTNAAINLNATPRTSAVEMARELGPVFGKRANERTNEDAFVLENFADLKASGLVEAGVPAQLGGGDADVCDLAGMLRVLAHHCGSTALAFAMHTHQVAIPAWRWTHQKATPVEPLLKRVAQEKLMLLSSGGSDWLGGSGKAERVEGGFRITARKVFSSGSPAGDLLMTGALFESEGQPPEVLHFGIPMNSPHVKVLDNWRTLGMRGTGSNDVLIDGHVVPEAAISARRKAGEWHPLFQIISTIAFPLIYAVYLGIAESARDIAVDCAKRKQLDQHTVQLAGRMDTELAAARLAHGWMLDAVRRNAPSADTVNQVMMGRQLVARHAISAVELAMEVAGGAGFFRAAGLERRFRDIQAARYHPMRSGQQTHYAGAMALGQSVERIF
jgi:alkylation response protein AidB-like acyl-CoA dehydrogenase